MPAPDLDYQFLTPLDADEPALLFRRMVAREELGRLPEYRLELLRETKKTPVKADQLLGAQVDIKLRLDDSSYRYINGFVTRFERGGVLGRYDIYRVEVRPWLWQLTLGADCKIFQDKTAVGVIEAVFADYAAAGAVKKADVTRALTVRPFTVQYRESDLDFVTRLMEEEGIYFYFTHVKGAHTLVLTDKASTHPPIHGKKLRWAAKQLGEQLSEDVITQWASAHSVGSLAYVHTDFAAEKPTLDLKTEATRTVPYSKHPKKLEVFDYPGRYADVSMDEKPDAKKTVGTAWAQLQVDRFESQRVTAVGVTPYRYIAAGVTFDLVDHSSDDGGYLITAVDIEVNFAHYEARDSEMSTLMTCRFESVPKATPYQPKAIAERPLIYGPQTATVVGASGDEIMTDKFARVKLQFRWDREGKKNDKSSCWVRVSQPWAGKQFGAIALPRIGDEVVVEFLEGNPDRPLITGRVYNGDNMPPYELPAQATVSGTKSQSSKEGSLATANELRFDDKKGSEYVWLQAEKDFHQLVKNDSFETIKNDRWTAVVKNSAHKVGENLDLDVGKVAKINVLEDTHIKLGADMNLEVVGGFNVKVTDKVAVKGEAALAVTAGAAIDIDAGAALKMSAASTLHIKGLGVVIDGGTQLTIKAGGAFISLGPEGVTIQGTMVKINCGGGAGAANQADKASPAAPKKPIEHKEHKDPLAKA